MADGQDDGPLEPFSDPLYLKAALLDPSFGNMWLTHDVLVPEDISESVSMMIKDLILKEAYKATPTTHPHEQEDGDLTIMADPEHQSGLFSAYRKKKQKTDLGSIPHIQLNHYLEVCDGQNSLQFWAMNKHTLPSLFKVAVRVMAITASSAPVERVFSHGGVIMRQHRFQLNKRDAQAANGKQRDPHLLSIHADRQHECRK
ncbi:uncharacterized protein LOC118493476 [Sander lucioperca]|uniref:uncharacterized protein LOC118493476 n=1 Tax=Sander lucioperca TaxID=283035 RepID=UPI0016534CB7|nr:uncharacterized protein LOC118493476 [Sander lucioperca]